MNIDDALDRVRAYAKEPGNSQQSLAEKAGLHRNTLIGMNSPDWSPNVDTLRKLLAVIPNGWHPVKKSGKR